MKFYTNQLPQLVAKIANNSIKSLLLYGQNRGYISAIISQLVKKFDFLVENVEGKEATPANLSLLANNSNFFKQKECLKINYNSSGINKELKEFLQQGNFINFICFIGEESLPNTGIRKFFEESDNLAIMPCYYEDENMVAKIATSYAAKHNKIISQEALYYIRSTLKGDHQLIKNELDKLINYTYDKEQISYEDVKIALSPDSSANSDEMCIYFSKGETQLFLNEIEKLQNQNINEILMIRALIRYYINLYIVISKIEAGDNLIAAIKELTPPIFFKYMNDFKHNVQKLSSKDTLKIIEILQNAELKFKRYSNNFDFFGDVYLPVHNYFSIS